MRTECIIQERRVEVDADYVVEKLRTIVEDTNCPASSQVAALGLLARHLGMLNDKIDINDSRETILITLEAPSADSSLLTQLNATRGLNGPQSLPDESDGEASSDKHTALPRLRNQDPPAK